MANILLTNVCNRGCPYCFAEQKITHRDDDTPEGLLDAQDYISLDNFRTALDFLDKSDCRVISMLGGEPTLHPEFKTVVRMAAETKSPMKLFTNGLMSEDYARFLADEIEHIHVIVNVNHPALGTEQQWKTVNRTLSILKDKASLSFNIYKTGLDWDFLIPLTLEHALERTIRFGLAMPVFGKKNAYPEMTDYPVIGSEMVAFSDKCALHDIAVHMDCGFVMCMFTAEQIGRMIYNNTDFNLVCSPIIDIGPDLDVWSCFPLAGIKNVRLSDFSHRDEIVEYFTKEFGAYNRVGALPECLECDFMRRRQCHGGCMVHILRSFNMEKELVSAI